jgi:tRNA (mo5U34)-methyltransferase
MEAHELEERIAAFPGWRYKFQFDNGVTTPIADRGVVNRQEQRRRYFFERLLGLTGGSLRGRRVLDLGCNAGFWSLNAVDAGADFVLGIDVSQTYVDQADLVFEAKEIARTRYRFEQRDIFAYEFTESFDLVLCLGMMDQVCKPFELFELISGVGAELIVIDTAVSRAPRSLFEVSSLYHKNEATSHPLVLIPSRDAVAELADRFGFHTRPLAPNFTDYSNLDDYRRQRRLAFICSRGLDVSGVPSAKRPSIIPWWVRDPQALLADTRLRGN